MKVKNLLKSEKDWTRGAYARNANGDSVEVTDETACCWCLEGAITLCYDSEDRGAIMEKVAAVMYPERPAWYGGIPFFNDRSSFPIIRHIVETLDI